MSGASTATVLAGLVFPTPLHFTTANACGPQVPHWQLSAASAEVDPIARLANRPSANTAATPVARLVLRIELTMVILISSVNLVLSAVANRGVEVVVEGPTPLALPDRLDDFGELGIETGPTIRRSPGRGDDSRHILPMLFDPSELLGLTFGWLALFHVDTSFDLLTVPMRGTMTEGADR